jgi:hypothetical protein
MRSSPESKWKTFVSRGFRFLAGIAVLSILLPAMAMTMPERFGDLAPWSDDGDISPSVMPLAAMERDPTLTGSEDLEGDDGLEANVMNVESVGSDVSLLRSESQTSDPDSAGNGVSGVDSGDSTPNEVGTDGDGTPTPDQRSDRKEDDSESTQSAPTSPPETEASGQSSGTITGQSCPCTVTGTVELKGDVSLKGDLTVDGGVLVARPGVNLTGNGFQIMFMNGGRADFQGSKVSTWSGNGSNANLTRDINFTGMRRIMFHNGAGKSTLKYFRVSDSGTPNHGDYPIHFHLNGNSTRGTVVEGVVVVNGRNHAFVPHGSHGITFKDVIAKDIRKTAFWWDAPGTNNCNDRDKFCTADNSNDIRYEHALVDGVFESQGNVEHHRVAGFLLNAGSGNVIRNSVVRNIRGGKDCSGFHWPGAANQNAGGNVWVAQNLQVFDDDCHAVFVWQNDGNRHVVSGVTGPGIGQGAYVNHYEYVEFDVSYVEAHAAGWKMRDGRIGEFIAHRHRNEFFPTVELSNVTLGAFTIDNGSGDIPGTYVLNGTNLSCGDIQYRNVVEGTRVIIDGKDC